MAVGGRGGRAGDMTGMVLYLPSSPQQVANTLALLRSRTGKTVDLGSGDGRLVVEAYKQGLRPAVGYELNPWLLCLSSYRAWRAGYHGKVSFLKKDLWKKPPLAAKLLAELPDEARVVAGRFPFPSWTPTSTLGEGLEQVWAYDMKEENRYSSVLGGRNGNLALQPPSKKLPGNLTPCPKA
ncbi:PREDICTED: protein FAM173A [Nipponia nippon]|uniref:protein FAM173A n=1 Tax=Nipponia nippon TaxID=128390 RepID=UPI000511A6A9|nr:PREDICTED: protein FAM173A [Nipponia nippon]